MLEKRRRWDAATHLSLDNSNNSSVYDQPRLAVFLLKFYREQSSLFIFYIYLHNCAHFSSQIVREFQMKYLEKNGNFVLASY